MDFFRAQDDARRRTRWLGLLFALSLISLLLLSNGLLYLIFSLGVTNTSSIQTDYQPDNPAAYLLISALIILIVTLSSFFKAVTLRKGGRAVAEMLDAKLLVSPGNPPEQRLLNIVEEMAIASGIPVPPVYIMEETAINAFAAGHSSADAVIGVTRGAIDKLNRDELQGVVAHEFSHILHGDMRLNLRLIGWLHGIMVLSVMGHYIIRAASASRRNNNNAGLAVLGIGLLVLGASGSFFGSLIKAAVSRQREYLADASAVQYTRNPAGIAAALKRIAADSASPWLNNPAASQVSHALFSEGVRTQLNSLFATHPPIEKRIKAIDPLWQPDLPIHTTGKGTGKGAQKATHNSDISTPAFATSGVAQAIDRTGSPDDSDILVARQIRESLPAVCTLAARETLGSVALTGAVLAHTNGATQIPDDMPAVRLEILRLIPVIASLSAEQRLALVNMCLPTLRETSASQYAQIRSVFGQLSRAGAEISDGSANLSGWLLHELVSSHLDRYFGLIREEGQYHELSDKVQALSVFFSTLVILGHDNQHEAKAAFEATGRSKGLEELPLQLTAKFSPTTFKSACAALETLKPQARRKLMDAIVVCIYHDKKLNTKEHEVIRTVSEMLGCPLPADINRESAQNQ